MSERRKCSWIWEFVTKRPDGLFVQCNICKKDISYNHSTSATNKHLRYVHSIKPKKEHSVNENDDIVNVVSENENEIYAPSELAPISKKRRVNIVKQNCGVIRQEEISKALSCMIVKEQLSISIVSSHGLRELFSVVAPDYIIPDCNAMLKRLQLENVEMGRRIRDEISKCDTATLSLDDFLSSENDQYILVKLHFVNAEWKLKTWTLSCERIEDNLSEIKLALALTRIIKEWDLQNKVNTIVHSAFNFQTSTIFKNIFENDICCAAELIQSIVRDALDNFDGFNDLYTQTKKIVCHFRDSAEAASSLMKKQLMLELSPEKMIEGHIDRIDALYVMFNSLLENRIPIAAVLSDNAGKDSSDMQFELSDMQWKILKNVVTLLFPLQSAITILCSHSTVTISVVRPIIGGLLQHHLNFDVSDDKSVKQFKEEIADKLRLSFQMDNDEWDAVSVQQTATFFDPRYKKLLNAEFTDVERQKVFKCVQRIVSDMKTENTEDASSTKSAIDFILNKTSNNKSPQMQYNLYLAEMEINYDVNPLDWWKSHELIYPSMATLAKKMLAIPATSGKSMIKFSTNGIVKAAKRTCLLAENMSSLIPLYQNRENI